MLCIVLVYSPFHIPLRLDFSCVLLFPTCYSSFSIQTTIYLIIFQSFPTRAGSGIWYQHYSSWTSHLLIDDRSLEVRPSPLPAAHQRQCRSSILLRFLRFTVLSLSFVVRHSAFSFVILYLFSSLFAIPIFFAPCLNLLKNFNTAIFHRIRVTAIQICAPEASLSCLPSHIEHRIYSWAYPPNVQKTFGTSVQQVQE